MEENDEYEDVKSGPEQPTQPVTTGLVETQAHTFSRATAANDAESKQLETALQEIKAEIVRQSDEINREHSWVTEVDTLLKTYAVKRGNVNNNIITLREKVKDLLKKKRQIQNLMLQKELEAKLSDATADMGTLETAMAHVQEKESSFSTTRTSLQETIDKLQSALAELKGSQATSTTTPPAKATSPSTAKTSAGVALAPTPATARSG